MMMMMMLMMMMIIIIIQIRCSGCSLPKISGFVEQWDFSDSVSVTCKTLARYHIAISSLSGSTMFFHIFPQTTGFYGKSFRIQNVCF